MGKYNLQPVLLAASLLLSNPANGAGILAETHSDIMRKTYTWQGDPDYDPLVLPAYTGTDSLVQVEIDWRFTTHDNIRGRTHSFINNTSSSITETVQQVTHFDLILRHPGTEWNDIEGRLFTSIENVVDEHQVTVPGDSRLGITIASTWEGTVTLSGAAAAAFAGSGDLLIGAGASTGGLVPVTDNSDRVLSMIYPSGLVAWDPDDRYNPDGEATIRYYTMQIPEPGSAFLAIVGMLTILSRRRMILR